MMRQLVECFKRTIDRNVVTKSQAKKMILVKDGKVHILRKSNLGFIGADWDEKDVFNEINKSYLIIIDH